MGKGNRCSFSLKVLIDFGKKGAISIASDLQEGYKTLSIPHLVQWRIKANKFAETSVRSFWEFV